MYRFLTTLSPQHLLSLSLFVQVISDSKAGFVAVAPMRTSVLSSAADVVEEFGVK